MFHFNTLVRRESHAHLMRGVDLVSTGLEERYDHAAEVAILHGYLRRQGGTSTAADGLGGAGGAAPGAAAAAMDERTAHDVARMSFDITKVLSKFGLSDARTFLDRISAAIDSENAPPGAGGEADELGGEAGPWST